MLKVTQALSVESHENLRCFNRFSLHQGQVYRLPSHVTVLVLPLEGASFQNVSILVLHTWAFSRSLPLPSPEHPSCLASLSPRQTLVHRSRCQVYEPYSASHRFTRRLPMHIAATQAFPCAVSSRPWRALRRRLHVAHTVVERPRYVAPTDSFVLL